MAVEPYIVIPRDQYGHATATAEWWWHIGTLYCGDRKFGFEVAANGRNEGAGYNFNEVMVADIEAQQHYQSVTAYPYEPAWAGTDPSHPWSVQSGPVGAGGSITMTGPAENSGTMNIATSFTDASGVEVSIALSLQQQGQPLLVWGTGRRFVQDDPDPMRAFNFYYSFTRLEASGVITIGEQRYEVAGQTWMDHEYGAFPAQTAWLLQNAQLENGVHLSTYFTLDTPPIAGQTLNSHTSILWPDGNTVFVSSTMTPSNPYEGPGGVTFFLTFDVAIPDAGANLQFNSLLSDQIFTTQTRPIYEGIASVAGTFEGLQVSGDGWIEQDIPG